MASISADLHLQLVQDALSRLDERGRCSRMDLGQHEDCQQQEHDEDGYKHNKEAKRRTVDIHFIPEFRIVDEGVIGGLNSAMNNARWGNFCVSECEDKI